MSITHGLANSDDVWYHICTEKKCLYRAGQKGIEINTLDTPEDIVRHLTESEEIHELGDGELTFARKGNRKNKSNLLLEAEMPTSASQLVRTQPAPHPRRTRHLRRARICVVQIQVRKREFNFCLQMTKSKIKCVCTSCGLFQCVRTCKHFPGNQGVV